MTRGTQGPTLGIVMDADTKTGLTGDSSPNPISSTVTQKSGSRAGLILGAIAVLFWSFGSALVFLGAQQAGTWPFVTISSLAAGVVQLVGRRLYQGELGTAIR